MPEKALPGDVVQVTAAGTFQRALGIVREVHSWGVGVDLTAVGAGGIVESYQRLRGGYAVIGLAAMAKPEVVEARAAAERHAAEVAAEAGA